MSFGVAVRMVIWPRLLIRQVKHRWRLGDSSAAGRGAANPAASPAGKRLPTHFLSLDLSLYYPPFYDEQAEDAQASTAHGAVPISETVLHRRQRHRQRRDIAGEDAHGDGHCCDGQDSSAARTPRGRRVSGRPRDDDGRARLHTHLEPEDVRPAVVACYVQRPPGGCRSVQVALGVEDAVL